MNQLKEDKEQPKKPSVITRLFKKLFSKKKKKPSGSSYPLR